MIAALGAWDDRAVVEAARRKFSSFVADRSTLRADDQGVILGIVAQHADQATFDQLHALLRSAKDEAEVRRYAMALAKVRDPKLAQQALQAALSGEIPPQANAVRARMVAAVAVDNPQLAWQFFQQNYKTLMRTTSDFEQALALSGLAAQYWNAAPLNEIESWITSHVPSGAAPYIARAMERARFNLALEQRLDPEVDAYVAAHPAPKG